MLKYVPAAHSAHAKEPFTGLYDPDPHAEVVGSDKVVGSRVVDDDDEEGSCVVVDDEVLGSSAEDDDE